MFDNNNDRDRGRASYEFEFLRHRAEDVSLNRTQSVGGFIKERLTDKFWDGVSAILVMPSAIAFGYRRGLTANADFLGGRAEIERFSTINTVCLVISVVSLVIEILLFWFFCVGKRNSAKKMIVFIMSIFVVMCTTVAFSISVSHIRSDLSHTTIATVDDYVLSTGNGTGKDKDSTAYYLGFVDKDELTQIPVKKETYDALAKGKKHEGDGHSEIYNAVARAGYGDVTEYSDDARIEYFFHSAMIAKAELRYKSAAKKN